MKNASKALFSVLLLLGSIAGAADRQVKYFPATTAKIVDYGNHPQPALRVRAFIYGMFFYPHGSPESGAYYDMKSDSFFDIYVDIENDGTFVLPPLEVVADSSSKLVRFDGANVSLVIVDRNGKILSPLLSKTYLDDVRMTHRRVNSTDYQKAVSSLHWH